MSAEHKTLYYIDNCLQIFHQWPCGPMDKAPDYGSGDSRFKSWQGRFCVLISKSIHMHLPVRTTGFSC